MRSCFIISAGVAAEQVLVLVMLLCLGCQQATDQTGATKPENSEQPKAAEKSTGDQLNESKKWPTPQAQEIDELKKHIAQLKSLLQEMQTETKDLKGKLKLYEDTLEQKISEKWKARLKWSAIIIGIVTLICTALAAWRLGPGWAWAIAGIGSALVVCCWLGEWALNHKAVMSACIATVFLSGVAVALWRLKKKHTLLQAAHDTLQATHDALQDAHEAYVELVQGNATAKGAIAAATAVPGMPVSPTNTQPPATANTASKPAVLKIDPFKQAKAEAEAKAIAGKTATEKAAAEKAAQGNQETPA